MLPIILFVTVVTLAVGILVTAIRQVNHNLDVTPRMFVAIYTMGIAMAIALVGINYTLPH